MIVNFFDLTDKFNQNIILQVAPFLVAFYLLSFCSQLFSNYVTTVFVAAPNRKESMAASEKRVFPNLSFVSGGIRGEGDEHAAAAPSSFINLLWRIIVCVHMYMYELESERGLSFSLSPARSETTECVVVTIIMPAIISHER